MGSASASGANRAQESIVKALDSPLLNDNKITGCKNVLLLIVSGEEEITIDEIGEINDFIQSEAGNNTNIIMGVGDDPELGDSISVTIIATGFNSDQQHEIVNTEAKKVIHTLEEDQPFVHDLTEKKEATSAFSAPIVTEEPVVKFTLEEDPVEEVAETIMEQALVQKSIPDDSPILLTEDLLDLDVVFEEVGVEAPLAEIEVEPEFISPSFVLDEKPEIEEEQEFVINEVVNVRDIEVIDAEHLTPALEEESQISFEFDLPLAKVEVSAAQPIQFEEEPVVISEVQAPVQETVVEEEPIVFQLEETESSEELIAPVSEGKLNEIDVTYKVVTKESIQEETTQARDSNPFDRSIDESVNSENEKRKEQLKKFNYTFKNNINRIEEMEKQPAYKRMGFDIDAAPEASGNSQMTLDTDSNEDIQFRSNNSFLHDNVD